MGRWAGHRNGQVEGEHPRKVRGPNPQSHRDGSPGQPSRADPTARRGLHVPKIKCRVGRGEGAADEPVPGLPLARNAL